MMMKREEAMGGKINKKGAVQFLSSSLLSSVLGTVFPPIRLSVHVQHHIAYYYLVSMKDCAAILLVFKFGPCRRPSDGLSWQ